MELFDLLEAAKRVRLSVENSIDWTYGEGCECGCKFMVVTFEGAIVKHCKTLKQIERTIAHEQAGLKPAEEELKQWEADSWEQITLFKKV